MPLLHDRCEPQSRRPDVFPNEELLHVAGSRGRLATPALVLDLDAFDYNIERMARFAAGTGVELRPHAKSHKSLTVARRQLAAGATGISCATLEEVETMVGGGIDPVLLTSPVITPAKARRLASVVRRSRDFMAVVDSVDGVEALSDGFAGRNLDVLIDIDLGQGRTGVPEPRAAARLAGAIAQRENLKLRGVQAYAGHLQHVQSVAERTEKAIAAQRGLDGFLVALRDAGADISIVTGSGTGTFHIDASGAFTEIQAGSYVFMDVWYNTVIFPPEAPRFITSLFVAMTACSAPRPGNVTTDAGLKAFATDGPTPEMARGAPAGTIYAYQGDEFGRLILPVGQSMALGQVAECITPHCDPNVNLFGAYHCVRGDTLVDIWSIEARRIG